MDRPRQTRRHRHRLATSKPVRPQLGIEGVGDVLKAFDALTVPTRRNALMRVLRREIEPLEKDVVAAAPYKWGDLKENLFTGTRLTKRQRQMLEVKPSTAELHFGTADPAGLMEEFGLGNNPMRPFFRPAWEGHKRAILTGIGNTLGSEIIRAGERAARKAKRRSR